MKTNNKINLLLVPALGLAFAFAAVGLSSTGVKTTLIFSHELHVDELEVGCELCHTNVAESTSGTDNLMPEMDACATCHDIEDTDNCTLCHSDLDNLDVYQRVEDYSPKFSHQAHLDQAIDCQVCHEQISVSDSAAQDHLPVMDKCVTCHDGMKASRDCMTCHEAGRNLLPPDHSGKLWMQQHGDDAKMDDAQRCMACHERNSCMECHEGDNIFYGSRPHPPGYEFKHPLDVRSGRVECSSCHESRDLCAECHLEKNVYPRSHQRGVWANPITGGRHRIEAEINIEQCTSCHGEETGADPVCAVCHGE